MWLYRNPLHGRGPEYRKRMARLRARRMRRN